MSDAVNHPTHYNSHPSGIECIEVAELYGFNIGNAIKYIWRAGLKGGEDKLEQDLKKAIFYVNRQLPLGDAVSRRFGILERKQIDSIKQSILIGFDSPEVRGAMNALLSLRYPSLNAGRSLLHTASLHLQKELENYGH